MTRPGEDIIAYIVRTSTGEERVISAEMSGEFPEESITPIHFHEELGRRLFYNWVCKALEIGVKRVNPLYLLGGCSWFSNEIRLDIYTYGDDISEGFIEKLINVTQDILREGLRMYELPRERALDALKERREILYYELLKESQADKVNIVSDDGNLTICLEDCYPQVFNDPVVEFVNQSTVHWRGYEKSIVLRRAHFRAFPSPRAKRAFAELEKEYSLRDHISLGRELDLFFSDKEVGAGLVLWPPNGAVIRKLMEEFEYKLHIKSGYQPVVTPHIAGGELFETSGHLSYYRDNMYVFEHDGRTSVIKPMNCPFHILIYKRRKWSYKDLPVRYFEFGTVYRYERAGTLHGLTRVRGLTQDDSHIFLRPDQIHEEIGRILDLLKTLYNAYGIKDYFFKLSLRDPQDMSKYIGAEELWEKAENALESTLVKHGIPFKKVLGEAAFYGPKIDILLKDSLGREWQCGTIQLDFNLPERFNLTYVDQDNKEKRVVIIHRALIGSVERFLGILLEYYAGRLPLWLSPVQVALMPVDEQSSEQIEYVMNLRERMVNRGIRAEVYAEGRLQARVRNARVQRVPLIVVIGDKEIKGGYLEATWISYDVDSQGRYRPREERLRFPSDEKLMEWIIGEVRRETYGIFY